MSGFFLFQVQDPFQAVLHLVNRAGAAVHGSILYKDLGHARNA